MIFMKKVFLHENLGVLAEIFYPTIFISVISQNSTKDYGRNLEVFPGLYQNTYMDKRKSEIQEHEKALQKLNSYTDTLYLDLGKYLFENLAKQLSVAPYTAILKNIRTRMGESRKISGEIKSLRETEERLEILRKEVQDIDSRRKAIEKTIPDLYEDIGSLAYSLYNKNTASFEQYEYHFFEVKSFED